VNDVPNPVTPSTTFAGLPCGKGPVVTLDGHRMDTAVTATVGELVALQPVTVTVCADSQQLGAGVHRLTSEPSAAFGLDTLTGVPEAGWPADLPGPTPRVLSWTAEHRVVALTSDTASYLVVHQNFNAGWVATAGGRTLRPVRVDGWQQGWLVPAGTTVVRMAFTPDGTYRAALVAGGVGILALLALALLAEPGRRLERLRWQAPVRRRQAWLEVSVAAAAVALVGGAWVVPALLLALLARFLLPARLRAGGVASALLAAGGVAVTAWSALPTVTPPGSLPVGAAAMAATAGALVVLAVIVVAASTEREDTQ
jgi:arabinofuranan 3-O-arabinosyltransferase